MKNQTQADLLSELKGMIATKTAADRGEGIPEVGSTKTVLSGGGNTGLDPLVKTIVGPEGSGTVEAVPNDPAEVNGTIPVPTTKVPMQSGNAFADSPKSASADVANDLLASISAYVDKQAAAPAVEDKQAAPAVEDKQASNPLELTQDILLKVASAVLSTEEGAQFAERELAKQAGAEAAQAQFEALHKQAAYAEGQNAFYELANTVVDGQEKQAADEYAQGQEYAVKVAQEIMEAQEAMPEEAGDPLEGMSEEELIEAIMLMAQQGQIAPEEAEQIIMLLQGAGEEGAAPVADEQAQEGAEAGMEVMANANDFEQRLVSAVNYVRSTK